VTLKLPDFQAMSHADLVQLLQQVIWDSHTGFLAGNAAVVLGASIEPGDIALFIDFCNVHACNHFYGGMTGTNERWKASFATRGDDTIVKWGGDEVIVLLRDYDVEGYLARLIHAMRENNVYAVIAVVRTSDNLVETAHRADALCTSVKNHLEETGQKPHRDAPYVCLDSHIIYEDR
jgi:hypothetical protein